MKLVVAILENKEKSNANGRGNVMSRLWKQAVLFVLIFGFSVLLFMGYKTVVEAPPIPDKVVSEDGKRLLFTKADIMAGQHVFQKYGLMDVGSFMGHGAYNGPDFTAEYLHLAGTAALEQMAKEKYDQPYAQLDKAEQAALSVRLSTELKKNRYNPETKTLTFTKNQETAYRAMQQYYDHMFAKGGKLGLPENYIKSKAERIDLARFFQWGAWACVANRPDKTWTYTNDWPSDKLVGNVPNGQVFLWSFLSLIFLVGGIGLTQFLMARFPHLGWEPEESPKRVENVQSYIPSKAQKAVYPFLIAVVGLFLLQAVFGVFTVHYMVEPEGFYGFDIRQWLPYSITRSWHIQLAIFWIATAWLAGGLFLAPLISNYEPKGQHWLVKALFCAVVLVAVGSLVGEWLGINNMLGDLWFWLGHQGWEYLELGRAWQILLVIGMVTWAFIIFRSIRPLLKSQDKGSLPHMLLYGVVAIPLFFSFGLMFNKMTNFVIADFWRWWVVHLWVEGFFELFTTIIVAYFFHRLGMVSARSALSVIYLDIIFYLGSGIIGTGHHYYWTGQPAMNMALGGMFSALEVVPLTLLTVEAWRFIRLGKHEPVSDIARAYDGDSGSHVNKPAELMEPVAQSHKWALRFLIAVGFWNFLGAGLFGFLINLPIVNYYEHATYLTVNHGHAAMMGVYGMLAVAAVLFTARYLIKPEAWSDHLAALSFWGLNGGLMLMLVLSIFPAGVLQLVTSYNHGFWFSRSYEFVHSGLFQTLIWFRMAGDTIFIVAGILPLAFLIIRGVLHLRKAQDNLAPEHMEESALWNHESREHSILK